MARKLFLGMIVLVLALGVTACSSGAAPSTSGQPNAVANTQPNAPGATQAPPTATLAVPADIPIMTGATELKVNEADISYIVKDSLKNVMNFYGKEMVAKGWKEQEPPSDLGGFGRMYYSNPGHQASFWLTYSEPLNQVIVRINLVYLNVFNATPTP